MMDKIRIGWATVTGIALGIAGICAGIVTGLTGSEVADLPPEWLAGIGVASFWIAKIGRYAQAVAQFKLPTFTIEGPADAIDMTEDDQVPPPDVVLADG